MRKSFLRMAGFIVLACAAPVCAEDNPAAPDAAPIPAVTAPAPVTAPAANATPPTTPAEVVKPVTAVLQDGTTVEFEPGGQVYILNTDGSKIHAPSGTMTLRDGTTFTVRDGMKADE